MKSVGIIAEYNPFHNGHKYHIEQARQLTGADCVVVIMSGNYTQRGIPAITDKYTRAKMALSCGADIVIELPVVYSCASAQYFAKGSVDILHYLHNLDYICFGSECGDVSLLYNIASVLNQPEILDSKIREGVASGLTYPAARHQALTAHFDEEHIRIIEDPNNILGIEYIKELQLLGSDITPVTIKRLGGGYNDTQMCSINPSASAIRKALNTSGMSDISGSVPSQVLGILDQTYNKTFPIVPDDFSSILYYSLLINRERLDRYFDITPHLANRISTLLPTSGFNINEFTASVKSKDMTYSRISRGLLHCMLNIQTDEVEPILMSSDSLYARILGLNQTGQEFISISRKKSEIPYINKVANARTSLSDNARYLFDKDVEASNIYNNIVFSKYNYLIPDEYHYGVIRL